MQKISKQGGRKIMGIEQTMDLKLVKKKRFEAEKRGGFTNYRLGFTNKIKGMEEEKSWGFNKLWI